MIVANFVSGNARLAFQHVQSLAPGVQERLAAKETWAYWDTDYGVQNEWGLSIGETWINRSMGCRLQVDLDCHEFRSTALPSF